MPKHNTSVTTQNLPIWQQKYTHVLATKVLLQSLNQACITWLDRRDMVMERNSCVRSRQPISPADNDAGGGSDIAAIEALVPDTP